MNPERMKRLHEAKAELEKAIEQAEYALEGVGTVIEAEEAHNGAVEKDVSEILERGDEFDSVVQPNAEGDSDDLMVWEEGVAGFLQPSGVAFDVGDFVRIRVTRVDERAFQAVVLEQVADDE